MQNDDSERKSGGGVLNTNSSLIKTWTVKNELLFEITFEGTSRNTRRYTRVTSWSHLTVCWKLVSNLAMELAWRWNQTGKGHSHENNGGQLGGGRHTTVIWPILVNYSNFYKLLTQLEDTNRTSAVTLADFKHSSSSMSGCVPAFWTHRLTRWLPEGGAHHVETRDGHLENFLFIRWKRHFMFVSLECYIMTSHWCR